MRPRAAILLATCGLLIAPGAAGAQVPTAVLSQTAQAVQANAVWLAYAPAPQTGAGALCLVDTGVDSNPDTQTGLIGSYAIGQGPTSDVDPDGHGTDMAMIAGGAGKGVLGAWPALKIVGIRATNVPTAGQEPTYQFADYAQGMSDCVNVGAKDKVKAVDLALSSQIPPSSDQAASFANVAGQLEGQNIAIIAAAGNAPGAVEQPAAQSGVFAVGADTVQPGSLSDTTIGTPCTFTATQGVALYAPGCGLDAADPFTDQPFCCDDGTSQASAFTAAVIVALMSYDPALSYSKAEQLLTSTTNQGDLDVAAAFQAAGLGAIVKAGEANEPLSPAKGASSAAGGSSMTVTSAAWRRGVLVLRLATSTSGEVARVTLAFKRGGPTRLIAHAGVNDIRTRRPVKITVQPYIGLSAAGKPITVKP